MAVSLFVTGFGMNSAITLHYTFIKEFVIGKWRQVMIIGLQIMFSMGVMLVAFVSIYATNWRSLSVFLFTIPICAAYPLSFLLE